MRIEEHEKLHFSISGDSDPKYELDFVSTTFNEFEILPIRYIYIFYIHLFGFIYLLISCLHFHIDYSFIIHLSKSD